MDLEHLLASVPSATLEDLEDEVDAINVVMHHCTAPSVAAVEQDVPQRYEVMPRSNAALIAAAHLAQSIEADHRGEIAEDDWAMAHPSGIPPPRGPSFAHRKTPEGA